MNWTEVIEEIRATGATLQAIKDKCGFASRGHVHDVATGKQPRVLWEVGDKLLKMRASARRRLGGVDIDAVHRNPRWK